MELLFHRHGVSVWEADKGLEFRHGGGFTRNLHTDAIISKLRRLRKIFGLSHSPHGDKLEVAPNFSRQF